MTRFLLAVMAAVVCGLAARAVDKMIAPTDLDKRAYKAAFDAADTGTKTFNAGDQNGCLKLYEGTLMTLAAVLDHRPELVKVIKDQMAAADRMASVKDRAFALRKALDAVMDGTGGTAAKKPLWDRLGGEAGVGAVLDEFLATAGKDPKANIDRNGNYPLTKERGERVKKLLVEQISSITGGPYKYTGRDMKNTHQGMKITEDEFNAAAGHLVKALEKYKVPKAEADELIALIATTAKDIIEVKKK